MLRRRLKVRSQGKHVEVGGLGLAELGKGECGVGRAGGVGFTLRNGER